MSGGAGPLVPTFHGFVHNSMDGLILFEACLSGKLHHVPRRPHDRERSSLIKSGSIFIYEENASGIKRWTDGVAWSPSRILGNFLIYRELEKPFPPGEKKRAMKRKRTSVPGEPYPRRDSDDNEADLPAAPPTPPPQDTSSEIKSDDAPGSDGDKELERSLIGSLVDSYGFRPDGLVKKTMSITYQGVSHHMVSYYKVEDVKGNLLPRPGSDSRLSQITIRPELYMKQNFRAPVEETEHFGVDGQMHVHPSMMYHAMASGPYGVRPGTYFGQPPYAGMYGMPPSTGAPVYGAMSGASWPAQQATAGASPYGQHPAYAPAHSYPSVYYQQKPPDQNSTSTVAKVESQQPTNQAASYPGQYTHSSYPPMQRTGSQTAPSIVPYQTPGQPAPSQFAAMGGSGRASYSGSSAPSPTTNGHPQHMYGAGTSQQYPVRSPTQSYGVQSAPSSAVSQSPHSTIRSPQATLPNTPAQPSVNDVNSQIHPSHMPYRSHSYAGPSGHTANDLNGLGISNNSSYAPQAQNSQAYSYGSNAQAFRPVGSATAQSAGQYAS